MGVDTRKPPLPAPTESGTEIGSIVPTDLSTDVSRRTDRTSYSIPEDGSPVTLSTKKIRTANVNGPPGSQTSLLIEYFEASKPGDKDNRRPSVRVKVTPSAKKLKNSGDVKITEIGKDRKPSYTRRISLGNKAEGRPIEGSEVSTISNDSGLPPVEVEFLNNPSDLSSSTTSRGRYIQNTSDVSSMPADSMLDSAEVIKPPKRQTSRSLERDNHEETPMDTLNAPAGAKIRSLSRERITQKVMEKLAQDKTSHEPNKRGKLQKARPLSNSEISEEKLKSRSRRSSKSQQDSDLRSGTESSLLRARDGDSNISGASKSSINPKLIKTVEDAIRRLILPEIETLKRQQSVHESNRRYDRHGRDSYATESTDGQQDMERNLPNPSRVPQVKPKVVLNRQGDDPGITLSGESVRQPKHRRSSRDSERSTIRRDSVESAETQYKARDRTRNKEGVAGGVLTAAALKHHDSRSDAGTRDKDTRERRKKRTKSRSRSNSVANTEEEYYTPFREIPPMPMRSEMLESDLTRESILSAESAATERPTSSSPKGVRTPIREVSRGSPHTVPLPESRGSARTPADSRAVPSPRPHISRGDLARPKSERSISSKARAAGLAAAGLGGAAGALYGHDRNKSSERRSFDRTPNQQSYDLEHSPAQSEGSHRSSAAVHSYQEPFQPHERREPTSAAGLDSQLQQPQKSWDSMRSVPSTQYPLTKKRHQGLNLENDREGPDRDAHEDSQEERSDTEMDDFYDQQHEINDKYRSSRDYDSQRDSAALDYYHASDSPNGSLGAPSPEKVSAEQHIRNIGANPQYHVPTPIESNVASLLETSMVSSVSAPYSTRNESREVPRDNQNNATKVVYRTEHENISADRWNAIRGHAQTLSGSSNKDRAMVDSPRQSIAESAESQEQVLMGASGVPVAHDPLPEIGHGIDSGDDLTPNQSEFGGRQSIVEERLGGDSALENRHHWPYEPTPPQNKRDGFVDLDDHDDHFISAGNASLMGAAAGLGIGAGSGHHKVVDRYTPHEERSQSSASRDGAFDNTATRNMPPTRHMHLDKGAIPPTPANLKDEGYMSAAQAHSPGVGTPLSFSKPPPRLFEDAGINEYHPPDDPFVGTQHDRHLSGNSHGMGPLYDASTGKGMDNIQSQDVVALMDHLTVRDGQRNARDTEILVTLVRSAADMRNSFDEMKRFIEQQNQINMKRTDMDADHTVNKILGGPRPPPAAFRAQGSSSADVEDPAVKKQNLFKRALKGLSGRSTNDLSKIEDMLMQLLDEMEDLREAQGMQGIQGGRGVEGVQNGQRPPNSLDSYERLRAAPESGYEPEGQAGTSSTPNQSGRLTMSPQSRQAQRMHSGYVDRRDSGHRISTVLEGDEDFDQHDKGFDNDDGRLTPTQEAQRERSRSYDAPQPATAGSQENTPVISKAGEKQRKHKSTSSSIFGIPKISRWSKTTTTSSMPDNRSSFQKNRPYSEVSQSGSNINVLSADVPFSPAEDDRLRSPNSMYRDMNEQHPRSSSPLIPDSVRSNSMDDPKYQANRHSLTLEHPQPRQGPTQRHQTHLESQAYAFPGDNRDRGVTTSPMSPDSDTFGSMPSLARYPGGGLAGNRLSAPQYTGHGRAGASSMSPISSDGGYSARSGDVQQATQVQPQYVPARPPKIRDDGPLVPAKVPLQQEVRQEVRQQAVGPNGRGVLEGNGVVRDDDWHVPAIPIPRKKSPYAPGGLLAPIEERYSLEQARSMNSRQVRYSLDRDDRDEKDERDRESKRYSIAETEEEHADDDDRAVTPRLEPRPAIGAAAVVMGESPRKLTGPREMPRSGSGSGSGAGGGGGGLGMQGVGGPREMGVKSVGFVNGGGPGGGPPLQGTVRRKPMPGRFFADDD